MELILKKIEGEEKREEYIKNVIKQYLSATGKEESNTNATGFKKSFLEWSKERRKLGEAYKKILVTELGIQLDVKSTAEIGKGINDTIAYNERAKIITPYPYNMYGKKYQDRITKAELQIRPSKDQSNNELLNGIDTLIIHNPYDNRQILNWDYLFDDNCFNIVVGVFGKAYDKNKKETIEMLKELRKKITVPYQIIEKDEDEYDNYNYIVTNIFTKRKERR